MFEPTSEPKQNDNVLNLCHMLSNRIGKAFLKELELKDVSVADWRVLMTLTQHAPPSGINIASRWAMDKMTINRSIKSLHKRGLIQKKQNRTDKRTVDLILTPLGNSLYSELLPIANDRFHKIMESLNKVEEKNLRLILLKIINHIDKTTE
jgi:DNA-binding MarR family transcriptional regulator